ncbi:hypothetical protein EI94DRAFT_1337412 [Lactarius quietus]|nr:hypothetical protein EI94DRAFT_1337412 [Lactarius quietus]
MAVTQGFTMYSSAATVSTVEHPTTPLQVLSGDVNGFAEMSMTSPSSPLPYFVHKNEGGVSPNLRSEVQANHPADVAPSFVLDQGASVDKDPDHLRCYRCNVGFGQRQALNRHSKDKHSPRYICPHCEIFTWSSGRKYLFRKHLEDHHPEQVFA